MATRRHIALERFGGPEVMSWATGAAPDPAPGEVLVAVSAIGVNFADTMVRRGEYRRDQPLTFTPGFEVGGAVLETTEGAPPVGAPVVVFMEHGGGYADIVAAPADHVFAVIDGVTAVEAAALFTTGVTALYAVDRYGAIGEGDVVLVTAAAGGLGSLTVQLAAQRGATVIGAASTEAKLEVARGHGARHGVLSDTATLTAAVKELVPRGADVVIDGVGGDLFMPCMRALAFGGRYVVVGSASQAPAMLDVRALMPRGQTVVGFVVARVAEEDPAEPARAFAEVQRLYRDGTLRPQVDVLPASEVRRAHELIESRALTGKLVLALDH